MKKPGLSDKPGFNIQLPMSFRAQREIFQPCLLEFLKESVIHAGRYKINFSSQE
jgi:hypothetical protein